MKKENTFHNKEGPWLCKIVDVLARLLMPLRDCLWPCKKAQGPVTLLMVLWDRSWPYEKANGLARRPIALWEGIWLCKTVDGLARLLMSLQEGLWPCKTVDGLARSFMALREGPWPCEIVMVSFRVIDQPQYIFASQKATVILTQHYLTCTYTNSIHKGNMIPIGGGSYNLALLSLDFMIPKTSSKY